MKYQVISLFAIGRNRKFKKGDIVSGIEFADPALKVAQGFLKEVGEDAEVTPPEAKAEPIGEARLADAGVEPMIEPVKPEEAKEEVEPTKPSITEVADTEPDFKITPAPSKTAAKSKKELTDI